MIQAIYKGIEIEMELHQQAHDYWKCDYTLIRHPDRTETIHHGDKEVRDLWIWPETLRCRALVTQ